MIYSQFLENLTVNQFSSSVKLYNDQLLMPAVFETETAIKPLHTSLFVNVPLIKTATKPNFDQLLFTLLKNTTRALSFDILNTTEHSLKRFIGQLVDDTPSSLQKIAVIGSDLELLEGPFCQMLSRFKFVEFFEEKQAGEYIYVLPLDIKIGTIVRNKATDCFGMLIYEDLIKRIKFYSDADFNRSLGQMLQEFHAGENDAPST